VPNPDPELGFPFFCVCQFEALITGRRVVRAYHLRTALKKIQFVDSTRFCPLIQVVGHPTLLPVRTDPGYGLSCTISAFPDRSRLVRSRGVHLSFRRELVAGSPMTRVRNVVVPQVALPSALL